MSKKDDLLTTDVLEQIQSASKGELEKIVVEAMKKVKSQKSLMKEDQKIQTLAADKKLLESGYKNLIDAAELTADFALQRLEAMEEV